MASTAASLSSAGAAKSGNPWARLTQSAPCSATHSRVISLITDSVKVFDFCETVARDIFHRMPEVSRHPDQVDGVTAFRKQFPIFDEKVYLSSCSQGALARPVEAGVQEFLESWHRYGNPWESWVGRMEELRAEFASLINAQPDEVAVTFSVSSALNSLLGSPGVAFMYMRKDLIERFEPSDSGWFGQENVFAYDLHHLRYAGSARRFETGSPPVPSVYATLPALQLIAGAGLDTIEAHVQALASRLIEGARARGLALLTPEEPALRGPLVMVRCTDAVRLVDALARDGILCSTRDGALRVSLHYYNTGDDVDAVLAALDRHPELVLHAAD